VTHTSFRQEGYSVAIIRFFKWTYSVPILFNAKQKLKAEGFNAFYCLQWPITLHCYFQCSVWVWATSRYNLNFSLFNVIKFKHTLSCLIHYICIKGTSINWSGSFKIQWIKWHRKLSKQKKNLKDQCLDLTFLATLYSCCHTFCAYELVH
jgi:hypothetical protein